MKRISLVALKLITLCALLFTDVNAYAKENKADLSKVPGTVIDHSPASSKKYIGSPSLAVLPNGDYVACHDFFGPGTKEDQTVVFRSEDQGKTWQHAANLDRNFWSHLFVHHGDLYLIGPNRGKGQIVIRKSTDGGRTWSDPIDSHSGLLSEEADFHTAPMPVVEHDGRLWVTMEQAIGKRENWKSFVLSAPVTSNLMQADQWQWSNMLDHPTLPKLRWIEGNIVVTPDDKLVNILRTNGSGGEKAAIVRISEDGKTVSFDAENDLIDFPGGGAKFTIRHDSESGKYWSLTNKRSRNRLVLISSEDLKNWKVESVIFEHPDARKVAWQYVDWLFEGPDIIAVSRTAYEDGLGGAPRGHDANFMTFHRIEDFRNR